MKGGGGMFTLFFRAMLLYGLLILTMRILGKRQLGELQPYEFALTIMLAEIIADPVSNVATPLLYGLVPVAAMVVLQGALSIACMKSDRIRAVVSGKPTLVINRGVIDRSALDRLCLSLADLLEGLRSAGFLDPSEVGTAIVEANGTISAFEDACSRPPRAGEMNLPTGYEGLPMILVMDGRVQQHNLHQTGRDIAWLRALLAGRGLAPEAVYLASLDTKGELLLQLMDGSVMRFRAMEEGEVAW